MVVESKATKAAVEVEHDRMVDEAAVAAEKATDKAARVEVKHDRALDEAAGDKDAVAAAVHAVAAEYAAVRWHPNAKGMDLVKLDAAVARLQAAV